MNYKRRDYQGSLFVPSLTMPISLPKNNFQTNQNMNQSQKFTEDDIPYNILNRFGFTREMIEDMPDAIPRN